MFPNGSRHPRSWPSPYPLFRPHRCEPRREMCTVRKDLHTHSSSCERRHLIREPYTGFVVHMHRVIASKCGGQPDAWASAPLSNVLLLRQERKRKMHGSHFRRAQLCYLTSTLYNEHACVGGWVRVYGGGQRDCNSVKVYHPTTLILVC